MVVAVCVSRFSIGMLCLLMSGPAGALSKFLCISVYLCTSKKCRTHYVEPKQEIYQLRIEEISCYGQLCAGQ